MENEDLKWNKRVVLITIIWACIGIPFIFLVKNNFLYLYAIGWMLWTDIGLLCSPYIIRKI